MTLSSSFGNNPDLDSWLQFHRDGRITVYTGKVELGQKLTTALTVIVAEELDVDLQKINILQADAHTTNYGSMMTVGSRSVRGGAWLRLREAGATAREMLVSAAAKRWGVSPESCRTENGSVFHESSKRSLTYGTLTVDASTFKVPKKPQLKDPSDKSWTFKYVPPWVPQ